MSWISLCYLASLNLTKEILQSQEAGYQLGKLTQVFLIKCEQIHIREAEFAAYDQSQTWTEQSRGSRAACFFQIGGENIFNSDEKPLQPSEKNC